MKIIIVGSGRTGCALIEVLSKKNHDVTVIDKQKKLVDEITDKYNVNGVVGSGASKATLLKAGADTADILIALTPVDEINLLSCVQAKALGTLRTVARVFQPDFGAERKSLEKEQGIDYIFNPKYDMAEESAASLGLPGAVKLEGLFEEKLQMVSLNVLPDSPIAGKSMAEMRNIVREEFLIATVLREDKLHVPDRDFTIKTGDIIGVAASREVLLRVLQKLGIVKGFVKDVLIIGGGITTSYLIEMLAKEHKHITVIESDIDRCRELMEQYPYVKVSYGSGEWGELLEDENIASMDAVVSLTDADEVNLVTSMYAWSRNVPSVLTRIDAPGHLNLLHKINLDITLSPSEISVNKLVRFIRNQEMGDAPNEIEKYCTVADNKAEVFQFTASESFEKELKLKRNVNVVAIIRDGELFFHGNGSVIKKGDKVIIVAEKKRHITKLNDILA
ncbi:MAG: Trk system potassium transporter TrkA [Lachnospiraceae bacterium]|nr:Trk system potassium transporter TrkA [Lachnospiraceae bacterium]